MAVCVISAENMEEKGSWKMQQGFCNERIAMVTIMQMMQMQN